MWGKGESTLHSKGSFRSRSDHTLDSKGRLSFPRRFRDVLNYLHTDILMVTAWGNHLRAFPLEEWEKLEAKLLEENREQRKLGEGKERRKRTNLVRFVLSGVNECCLDKQGRLQLPQSLRNEAKLEKDVVLTGMIKWVEIWNRDAWQEEHAASQENFEDFVDDLAELGIL